MRTHPSQLVLLLVGVALAFVMPFEKPVIPKKHKKRGTAAAAAAPSVGGVWSSSKFLQEHMRNALAIVPVATGAGFVEEPSVRASSPEDVVDVVRTDYDAAFRRMGAADDAAVVAMSKAFANRLLGVYDPKANSIHILPANAVRAAQAAGNEGLLSKNVLRLLLVRMAVIAQDRQLYPEWKEALDKAPNTDALGAAGAILQGHAQYVTERVATQAQAAEWSLAHEFPNLVTLLIAPGPESPGSALIDAEVKFAILKGHAFMKTLAKKRGKGGIQKHFREPPTTRNPIFDPGAYLGARNAAAAGGLAERVLKEFAGLTSAGGAKSVATPIDQAAADAMLEPIEKQLTAAVRGAFASGTRWTASHANGSESTVSLIEMKSAGMAEAFVNVAKSAAKKNGAEIEDGSGRDSGLPGYASKGKTEVDGKTVVRAAQWTYEGRYVLGFSTTSTDADRETQDDALEGAAEILARAERTRTSRRRNRK